MYQLKNNLNSLSFINSLPWFKCLNKKTNLQKSNRTFLISENLIEEDQNFCLLDTYQSTKFLDLTKLSRKYLTLLSFTGIFVHTNPVCMKDKRYAPLHFKEENFKFQLECQNNFKFKEIQKLSYSLKSLKVFDPAKGGFSCYWNGLFGFVSKKSILYFLKFYLSLKINNFFFQIFFKSIKIRLNLKKKLKLKNITTKIYLETIFFPF
jgi:hypothetical protein